MTGEVLPYGGRNHPNSGHAGSDTSRERAEHDDATGATSARQKAVLRLAEQTGDIGVTVVQVRSALDLHHGKASGVLSNLHKSGRLVRLAETRGRCKVYVLPRFVNDRPTEQQAMTETTILLRDMYEELRTNSPCMFHPPYYDTDCRLCRITLLIQRYEARK